MSEDQSHPIADRTIGLYLNAIASDAPAPGGGSVAGVVGALAASLGQMVVSLTRDDPDGELARADRELAALRDRLLQSAQADEGAYARYVAAAVLPKGSNDEKSTRRAAMQAALIEAARIPLETSSASIEILRTLKPVIQAGNLHVLSDADISVTFAHSAVAAALANVRINVAMIADSELAAELSDQIVAAETESTELATACRTILATRRER